MKIIHALSLSLLVMWSTSAWSGNDIPAEAQKILDAANFPIYPGAVYCIGDPTLGIRFASSDPVESVRKWYQSKFPEWASYEEYGGWILHPGPADAPMSVIFSGKQVSVATHDSLPQWHGLSEDMTTEIVIALPSSE